MKNFVGEEFSTVFQETIADIRPDSLRTKGFVPVQDLDALLEALNPKMFECFQVAKGPGDETPSARKFGLAFAEKVHPDHFSTPSDRLEFIGKVQALPETVELEWLLRAFLRSSVTVLPAQRPSACVTRRLCGPATPHASLLALGPLDKNSTRQNL